jgi:hypothetical protein
MPREMSIKSRGPSLIGFCSGCNEVLKNKIPEFNVIVSGNLKCCTGQDRSSCRHSEEAYDGKFYLTHNL